MTTPLLTNQWEIVKADEVTSVLVFGTEATGYLTINRPTHSGDDGTAGDVSRPIEDGRMFGRDYRGGKTVSWDIGVLTDTLNYLADAGLEEQANLDALDLIEGIWNDPQWRTTPGAYAVLRACEAGRTSRAYGRPRKYAEIAGNFTKLGYTPVTCTFDLVDDRWYADVEQVETCTLIPSPDGGFITPLVAPITTTSPSVAAETLVVGGSRTTWPVVKFYGPVSNPKVTIGTLVIALSGSVGAGQTLTVDTRPWKRSVRRSDGANFAGNLTAPTPRMADCDLAPGTYSMTYRGTDVTGTSHVEVRWRDARSRP